MLSITSEFAGMIGAVEQTSSGSCSIAIPRRIRTLISSDETLESTLGMLAGWPKV
jgi:hypothetical protein